MDEISGRRRSSWLVLAGLGIQGIVGYTQHFSHLPAGLVWMHVTSAALLWICVLRLYLATRERTPLPAEPTPHSPRAPRSPPDAPACLLASLVCRGGPGSALLSSHPTSYR